MGDVTKFIQDVFELVQSYGGYAVLFILAIVELKFKPLRRFYKALDLLEKSNEGYDKLTQRVEAINADLCQQIEGVRSFVVKELSYNNQSSTKDAVARIEQIVTRIASQFHVEMELHPYGIFMVTAEGKMFFVNRTFAHMAESTKEELLDFGWMRFFGDKVFITEQLEAYQKWQDFSRTTTLTNRSGESQTVKVISTVLSGQDGFMGYIIPQHDNSIHTSTQIRS